MDPSIYSEVIPGLFITNWESSNDPNLLIKHNIKAIISVEQTPKPLSFLKFAESQQIDYIHLYINDTPDENISKYFDQTFNFINQHLQNNENVLVHCMVGVSRSVTIVLNYLIKNYYSSDNPIITPSQALQSAILQIRKTRPFINPNLGFVNQLLTKAKEYFYERGNKDSNKNSNLNYNLNYNNIINKSTPTMASDCEAFVDAEGNKGNVICLTNSDFDEKGNLINFPSVNGVILFYAPWCGHCKHMKPAYARFSNMLKGTNMRAFVCNMDNNKDLGSRINLNSFGYEVRGFPTVCSYQNGKYFSNYSPDPNNKQSFRTAEDLMDYAKGIGSATVDWE